MGRKDHFSSKKQNVTSDNESNTDIDKGSSIDTERGSRLLPIDRGWAWVIAFSAFMNMTVTVGYNRSLSVLFVDIGQAFQESNKVVALMFTLHAMSGSVLSLLVANIFMKKFNVRSITVISALVNAVASVFVSFAPNITVFLLWFLVKGIAFGGLLVCPMSLIGFYFKKRRAFASALANAGFCVGYIVFPPLTAQLRSHFGLQGTLLILSGLDFHLVAINMLLRPVESYKRVCKDKNKSEENETIKTPIYKGPQDLTEPLLKKLSPNFLIYQIQETREDIINNILVDKVVKQKDGKDICSLNKFDEAEHEILPTEATNGNIKQVEENTKPDKTILQDTSILNRLELINRDMNMGDSSSSYDCPVNLPTTEILSTYESIKAHYTSQISIVSYGDVPCIIAAEIVKEEEYKLKCELTSFVDLTLFKSWLFRMMALFTWFGVFTNYLSIYMPIIAVTSGIDKSDAALLMTLGGVMDLSTRIITGFIGDFKFVSKAKMVAFSLFILCLVCLCSEFFNTYPLFVLFSLLVGTFSGFRQNFSNALLLDYFGAENLAKANGITLTIANLALSINHPVLGAMLDATGSFVIPLYYVGAMVLIATFIILLEPLAKRLDERNRLREQTENNANEI